MRSLLLLAVLLVGNDGATTEARYRLDLTRSRFTFDAVSTMGGFKGTAQQFTGSAVASDTTAFSDAHGSVHVVIAAVHTGIGMRDGHLRSDLDARSYPEIVFELDSIRAGVLLGTMTMHGASRQKRVPATLHVKADTVALAGEIPMTFTEFGVRPPSRLLGMARVHDDWLIHFNAFFIRER
jgi:polyisoprenoid-binding protein YceI